MAPSQQEIKAIFQPLSQQGEQAKFFDHVADNVHWDIMGHSPMSRSFHNKQDFVDATLSVLRDKVLTEPLRLAVVQVSGGGASGDWATVELRAIDAKCKNGLTYDMTYAWVVRFHNDIIVQVRAYICTKLLTDAMTQNGAA